MSSLYAIQPRRRFLRATAALSALALWDCSSSLVGPEEYSPEAVGKRAASGSLKSIRVYEAVHAVVRRPASPLGALELAGLQPSVVQQAGQPFVSAINRRRGIWVFAVDGEFPEPSGGAIVRLGSLSVSSVSELLRFHKGTMQVAFNGSEADYSSYTAASLFQAFPWRPALISWFRVQAV